MPTQLTINPLRPTTGQNSIEIIRPSSRFVVYVFEWVSCTLWLFSSDPVSLGLFIWIPTALSIFWPWQWWCHLASRLFFHRAIYLVFFSHSSHFFKERHISRSMAIGLPSYRHRFGNSHYSCRVSGKIIDDTKDGADCSLIALPIL